MLNVLSAILAAREVDLYPENIPFKFIKRTDTQMWDKGKSTLKKIGMSTEKSVC